MQTFLTRLSLLSRVFQFRTLVTIQLNFHTHVIVPCDRKKSEISTFNFLVDLVRNNAIVIGVPEEELKEIMNTVNNK